MKFVFLALIALSFSQAKEQGFEKITTDYDKPYRIKIYSIVDHDLDGLKYSDTLWIMGFPRDIYTGLETVKDSLPRVKAHKDSLEAKAKK